MAYFRSLSRLERSLLAAGTAIWLIGAIAPLNRAAWVLENILLVVGVAWVAATYRAWRLSPRSYVLIFIFFALHVLGAHYTYANTPIGEWVQSVTGSDRNHYDRIVHFLFGLLLVYPFREQMQCAMRVVTGAAWFVALLLVTSLSGTYEVLEWIAAEVLSPHDAVTFLGAQGDAFDAQKDAGLAMLGALIGWAAALILKTGRRSAVSAKRFIFSLHGQAG